MDTLTFDRWARALSTAPTRRGIVCTAIGLSVAGLTGSRLGRLDTQAKKKRKKKKCKKCGPCKACKKGKCKKKKPNDTACNGSGKCLNGTCNPLPTCGGTLTFSCLTAQECCSGICNGVLGCGQGAPGTPCILPLDCTSGVCTGYRCQ